MPELDLWADMDAYLGEMLGSEDEALKHALETSASAGLPPIQVAPNQGKFLMLLARLMKARTILEIGTLGGYSTIWLARGLEPGGKLITLEYDAKHAMVARANVEYAGLGNIVQIIQGPALETLPRLIRDRNSFDLIFIDADKPALSEYFDRALRLSHKGSAIITDNVIREGAVLRPGADPNADGVRRLMERMKNEPRVSATALQTVGIKGHDGFAMAVVLEEPSSRA